MSASDLIVVQKALEKALLDVKAIDASSAAAKKLEERRASLLEAVASQQSVESTAKVAALCKKLGGLLIQKLHTLPWEEIGANLLQGSLVEVLPLRFRELQEGRGAASQAIVESCLHMAGIL